MDWSPWDSPGQNTGVSSLSLLQGIFPTQGSNPGLPDCRQILYQLSLKGSARTLEWAAYPFSRGCSPPGNQPGVSCIAGGFLTIWATREALWVMRNPLNTPVCLILFKKWILCSSTCERQLAGTSGGAQEAQPCARCWPGGLGAGVAGGLPREGPCVDTADAIHCTAETNTTPWSKCAPAKIN